MKRIIFIATVAMIGCGGSGGGGSDGDDAAKACRNYCDFTCAKAVNCLGGNLTDANQCGATCFQKMSEQELDEAMCSNATDNAAQLSCHQLLTVLGFARQTHRDVNTTDGDRVSEVEKLVFSTIEE